MWVPGDPKTKGSLTAKKSGKAMMYWQNVKGSESWSKHAREAVAEQWERKKLEGPVKTRFLFLLPRGKTVKRPFPTSRYDGDVDKLVRALLDAMTSIVYVDDSQVCDSSEQKRYAPSPDKTGVWIYISTDVKEVK